MNYQFPVTCVFQTKEQLVEFITSHIAIYQQDHLHPTHWDPKVAEEMKKLEESKSVQYTNRMMKAWQAVVVEKDVSKMTEPATGEEVVSEGEVLRAIQSIGADGQGRIALTYESGPYDIDKPTNVAMRLSRAILALRSGASAQQPENKSKD